MAAPAWSFSVLACRDHEPLLDAISAAAIPLISQMNVQHVSDLVDVLALWRCALRSWGQSDRDVFYSLLGHIIREGLPFVLEEVPTKLPGGALARARRPIPG
eukprot:gnl/MRDRNA2_/MRDRNA2_80589_c0_seq2.p1 gnl/MRDRNA2_/MRDRNA2_80589_c0~~gnl/MRDRNA2_/MRDRNA2_80589_c0_seq2.p1  ORF type:complete len:102 (+),score=6.35 gnl/MRDRNA2_/MRDRNA2_80589_c0_seq2:194-499(+)